MDLEQNKMPAEEIIQLSKEYTFFSWSVQSQVNPIPVTKADGVYFWDADGKRYLDFSSQLMNVNIGHSHPSVIQAIKDQADRLLFAAPAFATQAHSSPEGLYAPTWSGICPAASHGQRRRRSPLRWLRSRGLLTRRSPSWGRRARPPGAAPHGTRRATG